MKKTEYWSPFYDDAIELIGKLPEVAAIIYRNKYHGGKHIASNPNLDWAGNFAHMLGFNNDGMK
jgi:citrate synthase